MLEEYFVQTCYIITMVRNEYGDYVKSSSVEEGCRFREISVLRRVSHGDVSDSDALIHLALDSSVTKDKFILFDGVYYQIERIVNARILGESEVQFIKCELKITDINIS